MEKNTVAHLTATCRSLPQPMAAKAKTLVRLVLALLLSVLPAAAVAQSPATPTGANAFDWEIGLWETHVEVRAPLQPDAAWTTFEGISDVRALAEGRANTVDLSLRNAEGNLIEGVALRLFNPQSGQWSINFASVRDGLLTAPVYGVFRDGRGIFHGQDTVDGRVVLVRFVITPSPDGSARFVQSYSSDGGATWLDNWIAVDTRRRHRDVRDPERINSTGGGP